MDVKVIRSSRKTFSIEITRNAQVNVRVPQDATQRQIDLFINKNEDWINKNTEKIRRQLKEEENEPALNSAQLEELTKKALLVIPQKAAYYTKIMGVTYEKISVRHQKSRWGSCSSKGNLSFNCLLMLMPEDILDYVIVHELAHRKEMNHSKNFWSIVEKVIPDCKSKERWLKENGGRYLRMMEK